MAAKSLLANWAKVAGSTPAPNQEAFQDVEQDPETLEEPLDITKALIVSHESFMEKVLACASCLDCTLQPEKTHLETSLEKRGRFLSTVAEEPEEDSLSNSGNPSIFVDEVAKELAGKRMKLLQTLEKCFHLADVQPVEESGVEETLKKFSKLSEDHAKVVPLGNTVGSKLALRNVMLSSEPEVDMKVAMGSLIFKNWLQTIAKDQRVVLLKIHFRAMESVGSSVAFLKFVVDATVNGVRVPGIPFQRDASSAPNERW
mmetsp:Transcript_107984/g.170612  ORF Transcript_107984/g.170612 Transcript_107984/m.170612 type:complete len:258 (+) Transcript_107984:107-880(+)